MKRTPLMFAALAPFLATAGGGDTLQSKIDVQKLKEDILVSQVIGAEVKTQNSKQGAGEIEDVLIASDGRIEAVLIEGMEQDQESQSNDQRVSASQDAGSGQSQSVGTVTDEGLTKVQWEQVSYDPAAETVSLTSGSQGSGMQASSMSGDASGMQSASTVSSEQEQGSMTGADASASGMSASSSAASGSDSFQASDLIGMEVHLSDAKSFGEVNDVLISEQEGRASALVVSAWEGFDQQTYALPVELQAVNREDNAIDYSYTESDVIALQEYERE